MSDELAVDKTRDDTKESPPREAKKKVSLDELHALDARISRDRPW